MSNIFDSVQHIPTTQTIPAWKTALDTPQTANAIKSMSNSMRDIMGMATNGQNPMEMMMQKMSQNNPMLRDCMQLMQNGQSPESIVRQKCQEQNIDVDDFVRSLQQKM